MRLKLFNLNLISSKDYFSRKVNFFSGGIAKLVLTCINDLSKLLEIETCVPVLRFKFLRIYK